MFDLLYFCLLVFTLQCLDLIYVVLCLFMLFVGCFVKPIVVVLVDLFDYLNCFVLTVGSAVLLVGSADCLACWVLCLRVVAFLLVCWL